MNAVSEESTGLVTGSSGDTFRSDMTDGVKDSMPILFALVPFSAVFGAIALENGLTVPELLLASMSIYAVASQYVMVDLLVQGVPAWSIVLAVFAINFRHVLYSAAIGRHMNGFSGFQKALAFFVLVDPQYAASERRAGNQGLRPAYYFAFAGSVYITWIASNCLGAAFGSLITNPEALGLDHILPLYFAGLVAGFHKRPGFSVILLTSALTSILAFYTVGSPWHITLGGIAGLAVAAATSRPEGEASHG
ncbi:AzlC family ABC transporter permease [Labrenzia sp. PHM005]|uniref:AzlC family ABC transporter permease n=1 Tax=Labrenzia sp. PHM005 TaxID=2590016 RepID=UPI00113FFA2E|nr:AzlC family ABC transporter permease [Labrenzia sp. PHM005]QDG78760.1 AzlC family ABC transporter permease [Labrenzia sp. PHM005]